MNQRDKATGTLRRLVRITDADGNIFEQWMEFPMPNKPTKFVRYEATRLVFKSGERPGFSGQQK